MGFCHVHNAHIEKQTKEMYDHICNSRYISWSDPVRGFGYAVSGAILTQYMAFFFVIILVLSIFFLLNFRYLVHRHELILYYNLRYLVSQVLQL